MKYFDEPYLTVHWVEHDNIVWAEWKDTPRPEQLRQGLDAGLDLLIQKKANLWLADTRFLGTMDPLDVKWVNDHWMGRVAEAGARWMAFVMPKQVMMQIQLKSFMARINDREIAHAYFDDIDEAWAWLRGQK